MPAIGILGGMGPQATARLYELLIQGTKQYVEQPVDTDYPEVVLLNVPVPNFLSNKKHQSKARDMLVNRTGVLEDAGCVVNGIACNTAHILLPDLQAVTKVPFVSIPNLVAENIAVHGYKRIGLLGSPTTVRSRLFDNALGSPATLIRPTRAQLQQIERYIMKQLMGTITSRDSLMFRELVRDFKDSKQLDVVILGCTELPLVYGYVDNTVIDTLQILSAGLLTEYFKYRK